MATKPKVTHTVRVGGKTYAVKTQKSLLPGFTRSVVQATVPQMRNLAVGSYVLLVEKILAGDPRGFPTRIRVQQLPYYDSKFRGTEDRGPLKFKKLSSDYLEYKGREGLDPRPLIATGFYLENIEVVEEPTANGILYAVRVPDIEHEHSGVSLQVLAGWLEFGTSGPNGMPPRPHWRPVALAVRRMWAKLPDNIRAEALRKALQELK